MNWHINQEVVCIKQPTNCSTILTGRVLTIEAINPTTPKQWEGFVGLRFNEINVLDNTGYPAWAVSVNFRPVIKTDISIFTEMLKQKELIP